MKPNGLLGFLHNGELKAIEIPNAEFHITGKSIAEFFHAEKIPIDIAKSLDKLEWGEIQEAYIQDLTAFQILQGIEEGSITALIDNQEFAQKYQDCQFAYIINLDDKELEIYTSAGSRNLTTCEYNNLPMTYYSNYDLRDIRDFWSRQKDKSKADFEIEL